MTTVLTQLGLSTVWPASSWSRLGHAGFASLFSLTVTLLLAASSVSPVFGLENTLARTPPMGWLAWERFICQVDCVRYPEACINSHLFEAMGERLVEDKWLELGYDHVNIDDCWSELQRDTTTEKLVPDHERFKEGIKTLAEKFHSKGIKLGIYGDCGTRTCGGYPGQLKVNNTQEEDDYKEATYFQLDADTIAEWQVDSLKFDGCYVDPIKAERICSRMAKALATATAETKRPIMLVCEWPFYMMYAHTEPDYELAVESCNVWRYYDDIEDSWLSVLNTIDYTIKHQRTMLKHHGPGHWFDPDQLVVGNFGLSVAQARAQMAIWCIWAAPLYMSNDLREIRPEYTKILQNKNLIGVDQDELGVLGLMVQQTEDKLVQAFVKPILPVKNKCPSFAVVLFNRATLGNKRKLVVGNFGLSVAQARAQMAIWCIWAAPLYMSNDLREIRPEYTKILQNKNLIGVDQDELGVLGLMVQQTEDKLVQAFVKPILPVKNKCPSFAVVLFNRATLGNKRKVTFKLADLLLAAPIEQAALNQERVVQYKAEHRHSDELLVASESADDESTELIDTKECLRRLSKASEEPARGPQSPFGSFWSGSVEVNKRVEYEVHDLFDESKSVLALHESLELLVEPSSVRALKLSEK